MSDGIIILIIAIQGILLVAGVVFPIMGHWDIGTYSLVAFLTIEGQI